MSTISKEKHTIIIDSSLVVNMKVMIENSKITSITFDNGEAVPVFMDHDGSIMSLIDLREQINEVITEAKKYVRLVDVKN